MAITINGALVKSETAPKGKRQVHTQPQMPAFSLTEPGRKVRVAHFQWYLGQLSHSSFYERRKHGRVPEPDGRDPRPYWWSETIHDHWQVLLKRYQYKPKMLGKLNFY